MTTGKRKGAPKKDEPPAPRPAQGVTIGSVRVDGLPREHPQLGLGVWAQGRWTIEDEARTREAVKRAWELGVRWLDTAEAYGQGRSERLVGDLLAGAGPEADRSFLVTKVSWNHLRPLQIRAAIRQSLERLRRPKVDLYLVHAPDPSVPLEETMRTLEELWREGRIGAIGVSNFGLEELQVAVNSLTEARIVVNQVRYNLLDTRDARPIEGFCAARGIRIQAYSPLARGLLVGRYLESRTAPEPVQRWARDFFDADHWPELRDRARSFARLAEEAGVPLASLALHWLRWKGALPLFGASRPEQVERNLEAWGTVPPESVLRKADELVQAADDGLPRRA